MDPLYNTLPSPWHYAAAILRIFDSLLLYSFRISI